MTDRPSRSFSFFFDLKILHKWLIISSLIVVGLTLIFGLLLQEQLSAERLGELKKMGRSQSLLLADLALDSIYSRDPKALKVSLDKLVEEVVSHEAGLYEISIIMHPSGLYYASTNETLEGQMAHPSLIASFGESLEGVRVSQIQYKRKKHLTKAYQFIHDITIRQGDDKAKVATAQILIGYQNVIKETQSKVFLFGFIAWVFSSLMVWIFAIPVVSGLTKVSEGMDSVQKKNFERRFYKESEDEIGSMLSSYNKMAESLTGLYEEHQSLSARVVSQEPGNPAAALNEATLRKADLTCLCARMPDVQSVIHEETPENIVTFVEAFLSSFSSKINENGGQVVKILGDKVYCLFEGMNSINNAIRASIYVNQNWQEINRERKVMDKDVFDYGLGLHAAEGIAGNIGTGAGSYTFIGDAAKIAEYLCSCAEPGDILVTSSMMDRANGSYQHHVMDEVKAHNITDSEEIFCITENLIYGDEKVLEQRRQVAGSKDPITNAISKPVDFEAGIPDMLEETLETSPLELAALQGDDDNQWLQDVHDQAQDIFSAQEVPKEVIKKDEDDTGY